MEFTCVMKETKDVSNKLSRVRSIFVVVFHRMLRALLRSTERTTNERMYIVVVNYTYCTFRTPTAMPARKPAFQKNSKYGSVVRTDIKNISKEKRKDKTEVVVYQKTATTLSLSKASRKKLIEYVNCLFTVLFTYSSR